MTTDLDRQRTTAHWATRHVTRLSRPLRRLLWRLGYGLAVRLFCRPLIVHGLDDALGARLRHGRPLVVVANHASHADTALLSLLLGLPARGRLLPAAAEDHFFPNRLLGWIVAIAIGGLPFPRHGRAGLDRCRQALADGDHVLLFPQGSRAGGDFQSGVGVLAGEGVEILPVHLEGTGEVLAKGATLPRRRPVTVHVGTPVDLTGVSPRVAARQLESIVAALHRPVRPVDRRAA